MLKKNRLYRLLIAETKNALKTILRFPFYIYNDYQSNILRSKALKMPPPPSTKTIVLLRFLIRPSSENILYRLKIA
jgi:hypothetical protein